MTALVMDSDVLMDLHCSATALLMKVPTFYVPSCITVSMRSPNVVVSASTTGVICDAALLESCISAARAVKVLMRFCRSVELYFYMIVVSACMIVLCVMAVSSLKQPSSLSVLQASLSISLTLAIFFSSVAACEVELVGTLVLVLDLVALRFAGVVRPVTPVFSTPLEDIPGTFYKLFGLSISLSSSKSLWHRRMLR